jgi:hypothetical protein
MNGKKELRTITVWQYFEWRCEYCDCGGASELRLYMAERLHLVQSDPDTLKTLERSASWLDFVKRTRTEVDSWEAIPDPRSGLDRRAVRRGGRRTSDDRG